MTYQERHTSVVQNTTPTAPPSRTDPARFVDETRVTTTRTSGSTLASRIVILVFGLIQLVIGLRIVLLALDAREGNALVGAILAISQVFVAPFEGIMRSDGLAAGGSLLDAAAVLAFIGWTLIELVVLAVIRIGRPGDEV